MSTIGWLWGDYVPEDEAQNALEFPLHGTDWWVEQLCLFGDEP